QGRARRTRRKDRDQVASTRPAPGRRIRAVVPPPVAHASRHDVHPPITTNRGYLTSLQIAVSYSFCERGLSFPLQPPSRSDASCCLLSLRLAPGPHPLGSRTPASIARSTVSATRSSRSRT